MNSIRKWIFKPKKTDQGLLARFYFADEDLNLVAAELDSFDGKKDPERCTNLVNVLRQHQDSVLLIIEEIIKEVIPHARAKRDYRVKFPDDILQESLAGQLWFGAECLAAGSSILNREVESASMRPLAQSLTKHLDELRSLLREQCLRNQNAYSNKITEALVSFDQLFADFELSYVSAMVPVKTMKEYDCLQDITVLFCQTVTRSLEQGLLSQDSIDSYDPMLMFTIPRLAIVSGLLIFPEGPLNPDKDPIQMSEMFRQFQTLLFKIRELLRTLQAEELQSLEEMLCNSSSDFRPPNYQIQFNLNKSGPVKNESFVKSEKNKNGKNIKNKKENRNEKKKNENNCEAKQNNNFAEEEKQKEERENLNKEIEKKDENKEKNKVKNKTKSLYQSKSLPNEKNKNRSDDEEEENEETIQNQYKNERSNQNLKQSKIKNNHIDNNNDGIDQNSYKSQSASSAVLPSSSSSPHVIGRFSLPCPTNRFQTVTSVSWRGSREFNFYLPRNTSIIETTLEEGELDDNNVLENNNTTTSETTTKNSNNNNCNKNNIKCYNKNTDKNKDNKDKNNNVHDNSDKNESIEIIENSSETSKGTDVHFDLEDKSKNDETIKSDEKKIENDANQLEKEDRLEEGSSHNNDSNNRQVVLLVDTNEVEEKVSPFHSPNRLRMLSYITDEYYQLLNEDNIALSYNDIIEDNENINTDIIINTPDNKNNKLSVLGKIRNVEECNKTTVIKDDSPSKEKNFYSSTPQTSFDNRSILTSCPNAASISLVSSSPSLSTIVFPEISTSDSNKVFFNCISTNSSTSISITTRTHQNDNPISLPCNFESSSNSSAENESIQSKFKKSLHLNQNGQTSSNLTNFNDVSFNSDQDDVFNQSLNNRIFRKHSTNEMLQSKPANKSLETKTTIQKLSLSTNRRNSELVIFSSSLLSTQCLFSDSSSRPHRHSVSYNFNVSPYSTKPRQESKSSNLEKDSSKEPLTPVEDEISLVIQVAEAVAREEARSKFKDSSDLVHRLFVCISGVADQLQSNFASDLRHILKVVFDYCSTSQELDINSKTKLDPPNLRLSARRSIISSTSAYQLHGPSATSSHDNFSNNSFIRQSHSFNSEMISRSSPLTTSPSSPRSPTIRTISTFSASINPDQGLIQRQQEQQQLATIQHFLGIPFNDEDFEIDQSGVDASERLTYLSSNPNPNVSLNFPAPAWLPDDSCMHCMSCGVAFTFLRRRHHCRNCGKIFCGHCSSNSVALPHIGHTRPVRVCNACFLFQVTPFTCVT